jgi:hypothetical protein
MRCCSVCGLESDNLNLFQKDKRSRYGRKNRCKNCAVSLTKAWKKVNPYYMPNYLREYQVLYREENQYKLNAKEAKRRVLKRSQTPELSEVEKAEVDYLYWLAKDLRAVSGQDYHVDHIHPVSKGGIHHPDNLQILPADINLAKGAKV